MKLTFLNREYLDLDLVKFSDIFIDSETVFDSLDESLINHVVFNYSKYMSILQKLVINI